MTGFYFAVTWKYAVLFSGVYDCGFKYRTRELSRGIWIREASETRNPAYESACLVVEARLISFV